MFCLMCHVGSEISAHDAMPCRVIFLVKLLFDVRCDVLLDVKLIQSLRRTIYRILLHIFRHIGILDDCFAFSHGFLRERFEHSNTRGRRNQPEKKGAAS
ncbi:lung cancer oncogene 5 [Nannochloropsis gaditana CCMP526]|uniref:lung cancer oncogene 5 n=1 Tax=Nannochloropsis gaditana (strain CCMP526) TaxID=1093141 RepID=UPI00029F77A9|nr:lung cancer oncogene 5 [Nannochloropsis gaditana CCMP526]EKU21832.1 lung cancer oncogene 5 [Nannochloropsis gaditana CCMP526]|eukprot:XP_005854529.1 lung cancer oncogene 5 [Nannochloropsis gaditana CCMP526]